MAKNISLMGASYSDVPTVVLPQTGGGTARFDDASITTATASDVASGKVFLASDGTITTGTGTGGGELSDDVKTALLNCFEHVAWVDDQGQTYYDELYNALYGGLVSISAVYTQTKTVYTTDSLDVLRPDLVVTATYGDGTTRAVTAYTLSGTLVAGTSSVTVNYFNTTTTFTVTVTGDIVASISAVYNQTYVVDYGSTLDSLKPDLSVTATYENGNVEIVTNYTQSGILANDISTITVSFGGKTDTYYVICAPANRWNNNVLSIPDTNIVHGGFYNSYPYHNDSPTRATYEGYWIDFDPRYKYTIQVLSENTFNVAVRQLTAQHFSAIKVSGDMENVGDTGWQNNGYEFNSAGTVSSNVKMLWIPMRYSDNTVIDYSSITGMTVTRTLLA